MIDQDKDGSPETGLSGPAGLNLNAFCSKDESRKALCAPARVGDWVYATDGQIAVRIPATDEPEATAEAMEVFGKIYKLFDDAKAAAKTWVRILSIPERPLCGKCWGLPPTPQEADCPECDGIGDVNFENDFNSYDCDCLTCDATGKVMKDECQECNGTGFKDKNKATHCDFPGGVELNLALLDRLRGLPDLRLGLHDGASLHAHYFTFQGGDGLFMPLRARSQLWEGEAKPLTAEVVFVAEGPAEASVAGTTPTHPEIPR